MIRNRHLLYVIAVVLLRTLSQSFAQAPSPTFLGFVTNAGQWPSHVIALSHRQGVDVWVTHTGVIVDEYQTDGDTRRGRVIEEVFVGATLETLSEVNEATTVSMFLSGTDQPRMTRASRTSAFQYRFPSGAILHVRLDDDGRVVRSFVNGTESLIAETKILRRGDIALTFDNEVQSQSFVYGSYVGGSGVDAIGGIAAMSSGDVFVCGTTSQMSYPDGIGGYTKSIKGNLDVFVMRCDATLSRVKAMTFFGGVENDIARAICTDEKSSVYIAIETNSPSLPTSINARVKTLYAGYDAFVVRLDSTLTQLQTAFYHGGNRDEYPRAIATDPTGMIYLVGGTTSTSGLPNNMPNLQVITYRRDNHSGHFPDTAFIDGGSKNMGFIDGFVAIYSSTGVMQRSRYFGGDGNDIFNAVAVDIISGNVLLCGNTSSANLQMLPLKVNSSVIPALDYTYNGGSTDGLVVKMNAALSFGLNDGTFAIYYGGDGTDELLSVWTDDRSTVNIGGTTNSSNILTKEALSSSPIGMIDGFAAQLAANGSTALFSTYFGGSGNDRVRMIRPGLRRQDFVVMGTTESSDYPIVGLGSASERFGATDGFFTRMSFSSITTSSLLNGSENDTIVDAFLDARGDIVFAAATTSPDLILREGSISSYNGKSDGYIAKFSPGTLNITSPKSGELVCTGTTKSLSWNPVGLADTTKYRIELKTEGDGTWKEITRNASGRSFAWKIPVTFSTGRYRVRVISSLGHVSDMQSPFTIDAPPKITQQPTGGNVCEGDSVRLTVGTSSVTARYQWSKDGVDIAGATSSTLSIDNVTLSASGTYKCLVSGECSPAVSSRAENLTVYSRVQITMQPEPLTVDEGKPFTLSISTSGAALKYQWMKDSLPIMGAISSEYSVASATPKDQGNYMCVITGACGSMTSRPASVVVKTNTSGINDGSVPNQNLSATYIDGAILVHINNGKLLNQDVKIALYELTGREVMSARTRVDGSPLRVAVPKLTAGTYLLEIREPTGEAHRIKVALD